MTLATAARELALAWAAADDEARRTRGEGMLRLREVSLVIHAESKADGAAVRATAARFLQEHSGRAILLVPPAPATSGPADQATKDSAGDLSGRPALISTDCFVEQHSGRELCSETVIIEATGEESRAARTAVVGLLVPDLPAIGWWSGEFSPSDGTLRWLAELSDQLVVDSERVDGGADGEASVRAGAGLRASADLMPVVSGRPLRDLAWLRLAPWRSLTAELFDEVSRRRLIPQIGRVRVQHVGTWAQALLYVAWFGARLGLGTSDDARSEDGHLRATLRRPSGVETGRTGPAAAVVESYPPAAHDEAAGLKEVGIYVDLPGSGAPGSGANPWISISRQPDSDVCSVRVADGGEAATVKTQEMPVEEDWRLLSRVLETPGRDPVYEQALGLAANLGEVLGASDGLPTWERGGALPNPR